MEETTDGAFADVLVRDDGRTVDKPAAVERASAGVAADMLPTAAASCNFSSCPGFLTHWVPLLLTKVCSEMGLAICFRSIVMPCAELSSRVVLQSASQAREKLRQYPAVSLVSAGLDASAVRNAVSAGRASRICEPEFADLAARACSAAGSMEEAGVAGMEKLDERLTDELPGIVTLHA